MSIFRIHAKVQFYDEKQSQCTFLRDVRLRLGLFIGEVRYGAKCKKFKRGELIAPRFPSYSIFPWLMRTHIGQWSSIFAPSVCKPRYPWQLYKISAILTFPTYLYHRGFQVLIALWNWSLLRSGRENQLRTSIPYFRKFYKTLYDYVRI